MEWFIVLSELGKGLLGAESAKKQGEINALLQLFGLEGEAQRRKMLEEEMALKKEAHGLQKQLTEAEISMLPTRKRREEAQAKLAEVQAQEAEQTLPLRRQMLEADAEIKQIASKRAKFEDLYERGITSDDVFNDEAYTDSFKDEYRRYYLTRQFRERLPLIKSEEDIGDLIAMFPEEARDQMMAIAQFYIRENAIKDYLAQLQIDTAELQRFDTSRKIAYDTVFNIINRTPKWDTMKKEERIKLLRDAIDKSNLPPAIQNFFTEDALKVFAQMNSETAELVRRETLIGGVRFGYEQRLLEQRGRQEERLIRVRGQEERKTQQERFYQNVAENAFEQGGQGRGQGAGQGGAQPVYSPAPFVSFVKRGNNINQYGVRLDKTALDRYQRETSKFDNYPIEITDNIRGQKLQVPFAVLKNEGYTAIVGLTEPTFFTNPNASKAKEYFSNLIRYRYVELQLTGVDANTAYATALKQTEDLVNTINSPQLKNLWNQYKNSIGR